MKENFHTLLCLLTQGVEKAIAGFSVSKTIEQHRLNYFSILHLFLASVTNLDTVSPYF